MFVTYKYSSIDKFFYCLIRDLKLSIKKKKRKKKMKYKLRILFTQLGAYKKFKNN